MVFKQKLRIAALIVAIPLSAANSFAGLVVISGSSPTVAGITTSRDQFRVALGGGTTVGANGLFDDGVKQRREIIRRQIGVDDLYGSVWGSPALQFIDRDAHGQH